MASKQSERRRFYREYRAAGIPFVQAQRLAKLRGRYATWSEIERVLGVGEVIQYCECCGPEAVRFRFGRRVVDLSYIDRGVSAHWTEEAK
jgi:hypothetical protein